MCVMEDKLSRGLSINVSYDESWKQSHLQHHQLQTYLSFACLMISAFTNCGVDFCVPMFIKDIRTTMHKIWATLFTFASSSATHLDIVLSLHSQPSMRCLHRFFACRGVTMLFISENGKTFKAKEVKQFLLKRGVQWRYNLPKSPWWGRGGASLNKWFFPPSDA